MEARFHKNGGRVSAGHYNGTVQFRADRLTIPGWVKAPTTWAIWTDLLHERVTPQEIQDALYAMAGCRRHTFLILTKRAERLYLLEDAGRASFKQNWPLPNVWAMVTAENQEQADNRVPQLATVTCHQGISVEPMLEPVELDIKGWGIGLVVCGPETGAGKRPCDPAWIQNLYEQCKAAGVAFFDKSRKNPLARELPWNE